MRSVQVVVPHVHTVLFFVGRGGDRGDRPGGADDERRALALVASVH